MEELIIKEREVKQKVVDTINNSSLPAFILKPIFKDMYEQLCTLETQQYEEAKAKMEKSKEKEEK